MRTLNNSQTITWDALGRLKTMTGTLGADYLYDADGQLAGTTLNGSTVHNRLVPGPWPDEIALAWQGPDLTYPLWSLQDRLGSVVAITDGSAAVNVINAYDEYGRPQSGNGGRMQYTGQLWLPDFGVYHYKARQYHPGLGRFLQTDPIGYAAGANLYGYVAGDPVNMTDPMGLVQEPSVTLPSVVFTGTHCDSWNTVCNSYGLDWLLRGLDWNLGGAGGGSGASTQINPEAVQRACQVASAKARAAERVFQGLSAATIGGSQWNSLASLYDIREGFERRIRFLNNAAAVAGGYGTASTLGAGVNAVVRDMTGRAGTQGVLGRTTGARLGLAGFVLQRAAQVAAARNIQYRDAVQARINELLICGNSNA